VPILATASSHLDAVRKNLINTIQHYIEESEELHGINYDVLFLESNNPDEQDEIFIGHGYPTDFTSQAFSLSLIYAAFSIDDFIDDFHLFSKEDILHIKVEQLFMLYAPGKAKIACHVGPDGGHDLYFELKGGNMFVTTNNDGEVPIQLDKPLIDPHEFADYANEFYAADIIRYTAMLEAWRKQRGT
jgi:hypothetical protein